jgi:hypothetical protein
MFLIYYSLYLNLYLAINKSHKNMKKYTFPNNLSCLFLGWLVFTSCGKESHMIQLKNSSNATVTDVIEYQNMDKELLVLLTSGEYAIYDRKDAVPFEIVKNSINGEMALLLLTHMAPGTSKKLRVRYNDGNSLPAFDKMTQAELWVKEGGEFIGSQYHGGNFVRIDSLPVPDGFTDHAYYIKYEGPGWESDKVGFRFYLDWRNAVDVFGKTVNRMVLNEVGQDGYDSYHEPADWGMDILKVGGTLGVGSIAYWTGERARRVDSTDRVVSRISKDGNLRSEIITNYYGWSPGTGKFDMSSFISIDAGSRMSKQKLSFDGPSPENICTGIAKDKNSRYFEVEQDGNWACIATWGRQSLADDSLGLALFYDKSVLIEKPDDKLNHVVVLKPLQNLVEYYYAAAWEKELDGVKTWIDFRNYINWQLDRLNHPVEVNAER